MAMGWTEDGEKWSKAGTEIMLELMLQIVRKRRGQGLLESKEVSYKTNGEQQEIETVVGSDGRCSYYEN